MAGSSMAQAEPAAVSHPVRGGIACRGCGKDFPHLKSLQQHAAKAQPEAPLLCVFPGGRQGLASRASLARDCWEARTEGAPPGSRSRTRPARRELRIETQPRRCKRPAARCDADQMPLRALSAARIHGPGFNLGGPGIRSWVRMRRLNRPGCPPCQNSELFLGLYTPGKVWFHGGEIPLTRGLPPFRRRFQAPGRRPFPRHPLSRRIPCFPPSTPAIPGS